MVFRDDTVVPDQTPPVWWRQLLNRIWPRFVVVVYNHENYVGSFAQSMHLTVTDAHRAMRLQNRDAWLDHNELDKVLAQSDDYNDQGWKFEPMQLFWMIQPIGYKPKPRGIEPSQPWPRK